MQFRCRNVQRDRSAANGIVNRVKVCVDLSALAGFKAPKALPRFPIVVYTRIRMPSARCISQFQGKYARNLHDPKHTIIPSFPLRGLSKFSPGHSNPFINIYSIHDCARATNLHPSRGVAMLKNCSQNVGSSLASSSFQTWPMGSRARLDCNTQFQLILKLSMISFVQSRTSVGLFFHWQTTLNKDSCTFV